MGTPVLFLTFFTKPSRCCTLKKSTKIVPNGKTLNESLSEEKSNLSYRKVETLEVRLHRSYLLLNHKEKYTKRKLTHSLGGDF